MFTEYLKAIRRDLFDGKMSLYEYDKLVKNTLVSALNSKQITYTEWARLYYEFIG